MKFSIYIRANWLTFLIGFNVFLFALMFLAEMYLFGRVDSLREVLMYLFGSLRLDWVLFGDWWRLITSNFLHNGILHIAVNMWALYQLGSTVYAYYGNKILLSAYVACGMGGAVVCLLLSGDVITVGASAATFGLIGLLLAGSRRQNPYGLDLPFRPWDVLPLAIYAFMIGLLPGSNISNAAHLGGFLTGLLMGSFFHNRMTTWRPKYEYWVETYGYYFSIALLVGAFAWMLVSLPMLLSA